MKRIVRWLIATGIAAAAAAALAATQLVGGGGSPRQLLPDLDPAAPQSLYVRRHQGRWVLAFGAAVDNVGRGPLVVEGRRPAGKRAMVTRQAIRRSDGSVVRRALGSLIWYEHAETHEHWHLHQFMKYELRRDRDSAGVVRIRKAGFCLGDRYETNRNRRLPGEPATAQWTHECGKGRHELRTMREGISVGYGDDYAPYLEGQYVDLRGVPAGRYLLVHIANPARLMAERSYANNASSLLVQLRRPAGRAPLVRVISRCPARATCG